MQEVQHRMVTKVNKLPETEFSKDGSHAVAWWAMAIALLVPINAVANISLRMQTDLGGVDMDLFDIDTPETVDNFMNYVNRGDYDGTFIHRSVPGFVLQMGGYVFNPDEGDFFGSGTVHIDTDPPVVNEPGISNVRGTIAMAKLGGDPDSATSEFFFNLADNSANLDNQNGGFTVFGEVTGNGMETIDRIADETRCVDYFIFNSGQCDGIISFNDAPLPHMLTNGLAFLNLVSPVNTVQIINVGEDADGDGIIDRVENNGPNGGDANDDGLLDSGQNNVAAFESEAGDYLYLESQPGVIIDSMEVMGQTYGLTTFSLAEPPQLFEGTNIAHGYIGFELHGIGAGDPATVTLTLPTGQKIRAYFMYGPTPDNPEAHWYRFDFDGETGAEINGNVAVLHFVDGLRGDSDLQANGVIVDPGTPALTVKNSAAGGGGSSGCSIAPGRHGASPAQAGAWCLMVLLLGIQGLRLRASRHSA